MASGWGACDPNEPKNRRRRCSLLVEQRDEDGCTTLLVDTSPDLREQLLSQHVRWLDGVIMTHDHADHAHGIDDLRPIAIYHRRRLAVYMSTQTQKTILGRFRYCFEAPEGSGYPPILDAYSVNPPKPIILSGAGGDVVVTPFDLEHGETTALGLRFGSLAYCCDVSAIPEASIQLLEGLEVLIIDALRYTPHPSHFTVDDALAWIDRLKPRRAILTNMHVDLDYRRLCRELPANVEPAYDGMRIAFEGGRLA